MSTWRLVADAGGTNVRFARADRSGGLGRVMSYRTADFQSFAEALIDYLAATGGQHGCEACAIGAAGPVEDGFVTLTNYGWSIDGADISASMAGVPVALVNDVEAVAAALPHLGLEHVQAIGGPAVSLAERRTMLAVNVGTGFGAAAAAWHDGRWWTLPSEAGHMTLGVAERDDIDLLPPGATVESVLSGKGIKELQARLSGATEPDEATSVFVRAGRDPHAARVLDVVTHLLGRVAGDLALASGAWGGVYLCGSVALAWSAVADAVRFRVAFESKGSMRPRMQRVPTAVIRRENVSLFGLAVMPISR